MYVAPSLPDGSQLHIRWRTSSVSVSGSLDGTRTASVQLQGFRWINWAWIGTPRPIASRCFRPTIAVPTSCGRSHLTARTFAGSTQMRPPISAMCSSPTAGVLYLFRERKRRRRSFARLPLSGEQDQEPTVLATVFRCCPTTRCDVSADGERLLYTRTSGHANIWRLNLRGAATAATSLTHGTSVFAFPRVSPDGQWIVATTRVQRRPSNREDSHRWR